MFVGYFTNDDESFQTLLDRQVVPGRYWKKPDWYVFVERTDGWENESRNEVYNTFSLEHGENVVSLLGTGSLWFCAPIWVK